MVSSERIKMGLLVLVGLWCLAPEPVVGQPDYGTRLGLQQGDEWRHLPQGGRPMLEVVDPLIRKWYLPQELYAEYRWRQWESTNYAREFYGRYVETDLAGDYFYDLYGNFLTQGWLIFNAGQTSPAESGHVLFKGQKFSEWFSDVVIASEQKGQYHYALTASNDLRTIFTPLVLSKIRFSAIQFDASTDKYNTTLFYSQGALRGRTDTERLRTNATTLMGGRLVAQVGDFTEIGFHLVNAHQSNSLDGKLVSNLVAGSLTEGQNKVISSIEIELRDDSPADGRGGAAFFPAGSDIFITYRDGTRDAGKDIRFEPTVEGGLVREGSISANGDDTIRLIYDFTNPDFVNRAHADRSEIVAVEFQLALANDFQVWISSDQQTDRVGTPVFLLVERAEGNVQDKSNLRLVNVEYGLPTATHLLGGTLKVKDVWGIDLYGEYDLNWNYRKYPNPQEETHKTSAGIRGKRKVPAWMLNLSKEAYPFSFFGELYSIDPLYSTQTFITASDGTMDYANERRRLDLVEDNDDQDRFPDVPRFDTALIAQAGERQTVDLQVFPGWDRNGDFLPDFNQNDSRLKPNSIPDYDEPFLRFGVDRPEFLFGVDMNHNFWADLYENDSAPDYPYRVDHRGFNLFGGLHLTPQLELKIGGMREQLIGSEQKNYSNYGQLKFAGKSPRWGYLRLFEMMQWVEDDIPDPLLQWAPDNTVDGGRLQELEDPLLARDTWINQFFVGYSLKVGALELVNKVHHVYFHQLMEPSQRLRFGLDKSDFFFGLINKASYRYRLGHLTLEPRWKSEYLDQSRNLFDARDQKTLTELFSGLVEMRLMHASSLQMGIEYLLSTDFHGQERDFTTLSGGVQFANESSYLGYVLKTLTGFVIERKDPKGRDPTTAVQSFITVYAGME